MCTVHTQIVPPFLFFCFCVMRGMGFGAYAAIYAEALFTLVTGPCL